MWDIKQILLDLSSTLLAFCVGLAVFSKLDRFNRILFLQVVVYLLADSFAILYPKYSNLFFNLFMPIETLLLFSAALYYFNTKKSKAVLLILYVVFLIIYFPGVFSFGGISTFAHHAAITEGLLLTGINLVMLYVDFTQGKNGFSYPVTFAGTGMILYFASTIPFLCVMFYFQQQDSYQTKELFNKIVVFTAWLRYLFIAIAFFIASRKPLNSTQQNF